MSKAHEEAARAQLRRILESTFFRGSERCCRFLEYSVRHVLRGGAPVEMKERNIGIEVFQRSPTYDTAQDNVVRVTANEVRKRLAQYYSCKGAHETLVMGLPLGTYAVTLQYATPTPSDSTHDLSAQALPDQSSEAATPLGKLGKRATRRSWGIPAVLALALIASLATVFSYLLTRPHDVAQDAWTPVLESQKIALICVAQPPAYTHLSTGQFIPVPDSFVGVGDAYAMSEVARFLTARGKSWRMVAGNETPSQELKSGPIILIGANTNPWTLRLTENLRFSFDVERAAVIDRSQPGKEWQLTNITPDWKAPQDYAIVSRFLSPETGEPVIVLAGVTNSGTQAAGEFFTSPEMLNAALRQAPKGWKEKNFQLVLHTRIIGKTPERPTVVAMHFW